MMKTHEKYPNQFLVTRIILWMSIIPHVVKKFLTSYRFRRFIAVFTKARSLSLPSARWTKSMPYSFRTILKFSSLPCLCVSNYLFPSSPLLKYFSSSCWYMGFALLANVNRLMRWRHIAQVGDMRNSYKILVRNHEGTRPVERPSLRWEDNIQIDLQQLSTYRSDFIQMVQSKIQFLAVVYTEIGSIKGSKLLD
jgi:hypothetical protein